MNKTESAEGSSQEVTLSNIDQVTTRGDGILEKKERFSKDDIDFAAATHLKIHQEGAIAGSQFNNEVFADSQAVIEFLKTQLPSELYYDQFDRCELTMDVSAGQKPVGWTGVKSIEDIKALDPDIKIIKVERMQNGILDEVEGVQGHWYPETIKDSETGKFITAKNEDGTIKNEKAKFEPLANIAEVPEESFGHTLETSKITLIMQKDKKTGKPSLLTIFPGDNAPAFPVKIDTESYKTDSLDQGSKESIFWNTHVFLKRKPQV